LRGLALKAECVIKDLNDHIAEIGYCSLGIQKFLNQRGQYCKKLYLSLLLISDNSDVIRFSWTNTRGEHFSSNLFGECLVGGSGASEFINIIHSEEQKLARYSRTFTPCENAILLTAGLIARLSGEQARRGSGLASLYGGGFEMVTVFGGKLVKFDDITYHLWGAEIGGKNDLSVTFHSNIRYAYEGDMLIVRRLIPCSAPASSIDDYFVISPVHKTLSKEEGIRYKKGMVKTDFDTRIIKAFYFHVPQAKPPGDKIILIHSRAVTGNSATIFIERENHLEIQISREFVNSAHDLVRQSIGD
jgi:hypothetical protein